MSKRVWASKSQLHDDRHIIKIRDEVQNELSMFIDEDTGEMEMRLFKKNRDSYQVFSGVWENGKLTFYFPPDHEEPDVIWG